MKEQYRLYQTLPQMNPPRAWAEIDLSALRYNYRRLCAIAREQDPAVRPIAVVKADAYGHGAPACVSALLAEGCDFFAVACIEEALAVREVCRRESAYADILILGYTPPALAPELASADLLQALLSPEYAAQLESAASAAEVCVRAHLAVDTGMNRIGFCAHGADEIAASAASAARVCSYAHLRVEGCLTHFARADEPLLSEGDACTAEQSRRYRAFCDALREQGVALPFLHICNSAASVRRADDRLCGVRLGILLYGARPSSHVVLPLRSVMRLRCVIAHLHRLLPGEGVSYGGCFCVDRERLIATLPIGYADGLSRAYSGIFVTVETANGDRAAPIVGRICMDQCMIDVTDLGARVGDTVTVFGNSPDQLAAISAHADTIDYEVLCRVSARVPRIYLEETTDFHI